MRVSPDAPYKKDQLVVGFSDPLSDKALTQISRLEGRNPVFDGVVPRITRAQSMDVLSSMATIAGYKAVLLAADGCRRCSR